MVTSQTAQVSFTVTFSQRLSTAVQACTVPVDEVKYYVGPFTLLKSVLREENSHAQNCKLIDNHRGAKTNPPCSWEWPGLFVSSFHHVGSWPLSDHGQHQIPGAPFCISKLRLVLDVVGRMKVYCCHCQP